MDNEKLSARIAREGNAELKYLRESGASKEERLAAARRIGAAFGTAWAYEDISASIAKCLARRSTAELEVLNKALKPCDPARRNVKS